MKRLTYLACTLAVSVMVAAMIGWSMAAGNFFVPVIAIPLGTIVILACRRNVQEVICDERLNKVHSKAALRTLEVVIIAGAIAAVILSSFVISDSLSPKVSGRIYAGENGTSSMTISLYKPGSPETPENLVRSTTIRDVNAMNESEAIDYCQYRREAFLENGQKGLAGMTIGFGLIALLVTFGAFYLYYDRKY
jgi:uncharacterized membrane protein